MLAASVVSRGRLKVTDVLIRFEGTSRVTRGEKAKKKKKAAVVLIKCFDSAVFEVMRGSDS